MGSLGGRSMSGNVAMTEHGILNEGSDLRAHVCPRERRIYVYPTTKGAAAVQSDSYLLVPAHQNGVEGATAMGCWVPPDDIEECISISPREATWQAIGFRDDDGLGEKGRKALRLVKGLIQHGLFPGSLGGIEITDRDLQIEGMDIIIRAMSLPERRVQVKCDYKGGRSGLYLQTEERNPLGIH